MAETTDLQRLVVSMEARYASMERELKKANAVANKQARVIETRFQKMNGSIAASLGRIGLLVGGALSVREVLSYADAWTRANNSLKVSGVAAADVASTLERLYEIAQGSGAALEPTVTLYSRLSQAAGELGASQEELFQFTEGVGAALKVAGTDAAAASGALLQLSQALGGSIVRAEEFNSINEGARPILQAVANGLDAAGGSVAKLRSLVIDGEVTSRAFFEAFLKGAGDLKSQAAGAATTVSQALTKIDNAFLKFIGETDAGLGASQRLVAGLNAIADNFDRVADVALQLAAVLAAALVGRGIGRMLAVLPEAAVAVGALITAMRTGTLVAGGFAAAMGPIGLIVGAASATIAILAFSQDEAEEAARGHKETLEKVNPVLADLKGATDDALLSVRALGDAWIVAARKSIASAATQVQASRMVAEADAGMMIGEAEGGRGATFTDRDFDTAARISEVAARDPRLRRATQELNDAAARLREAEDAIKKIEEEASARGLPPPRTAGTTGGAGGSAPAADKASTKIDDVIADLRAERDQLGRTAREQAVYNALQRAGITDAHVRADAVRAAALALYDEEQIVSRNIAAMDALRDATQELASTIVDGFLEGKDAGEAFGDAIEGIAKRLLNSGIEGIIASIFGAGSTSGTGPLGAIASAIFGGARASGGPVSAGKAYLVGERGPELIVPRVAGAVIPNAQLGRGGGGVAVSYAPHITIQGNADERAIRAMRDGMMRDLEHALPGMIGKARGNRRIN
jgi:tape measure domain-containing protein